MFTPGELFGDVGKMASGMRQRHQLVPQPAAAGRLRVPVLPRRRAGLEGPGREVLRHRPPVLVLRRLLPGGHEALGEIQRYPADFNGVLAGAPASIMTELNSVLHEYTFAANYTQPHYSGRAILDQPEASVVLNAALKACAPRTGLILDDRACEEKFNP